MRYGCVWRCNYWAKDWTIKKFEICLGILLFSPQHWIKLTGIENGSWKPSWSIRISSIVWNMTDKEIINTADLEDRIQMTKNI